MAGGILSTIENAFTGLVSPAPNNPVVKGASAAITGYDAYGNPQYQGYTIQYDAFGNPTYTPAGFSIFGPGTTTSQSTFGDNSFAVLLLVGVFGAIVLWKQL